jgi:hypothetical protein
MALVSAIITADELAAFVGGDSADPWVTASTAAANGAVLGYLGRTYDDGQPPAVDPPVPVVPDEVHAATLVVGADLYHRRQAPLGISSALDVAGLPLRVTRDWLAGVAEQLDRYRDLTQGVA